MRGFPTEYESMISYEYIFNKQFVFLSTDSLQCYESNFLYVLNFEGHIFNFKLQVK